MSPFGEVRVLLPQVKLELEGETRSWDQTWLEVIHTKRSLSNCVLDGRIPTSVRVSEQALLRQSRQALERWIARVQAHLQPDLQQPVVM